MLDSMYMLHTIICLPDGLMTRSNHPQSNRLPSILPVVDHCLQVTGRGTGSAIEESARLSLGLWRNRYIKWCIWGRPSISHVSHMIVT